MKNGLKKNNIESRKKDLEEAGFLSKIRKWSGFRRQDWRWEGRPQFRDHTVDAIDHISNLEQTFQKERKLFMDVERTLDSWSLYSKEALHQLDKFTGDAVITVEDCLRLKQSRRPIKPPIITENPDDSAHDIQHNSPRVADSFFLTQDADQKPEGQARPALVAENNSEPFVPAISESKGDSDLQTTVHAVTSPRISEQIEKPLVGHVTRLRPVPMGFSAAKKHNQIRLHYYKQSSDNGNFNSHSESCERYDDNEGDENNNNNNNNNNINKDDDENYENNGNDGPTELSRYLPELYPTEIVRARLLTGENSSFKNAGVGMVESVGDALGPSGFALVNEGMTERTEDRSERDHQPIEWTSYEQDANENRDSRNLSMVKPGTKSGRRKLAELLDRQDSWLEQRRQKIYDLKLEKESVSLKSLVSVPDVKKNMQSWETAKKKHEQALNRLHRELSEEQTRKNLMELREEKMARLLQKLKQGKPEPDAQCLSSVVNQPMKRRLILLPAVDGIRKEHVNSPRAGLDNSMKKQDYSAGIDADEQAREELSEFYRSEHHSASEEVCLQAVKSKKSQAKKIKKKSTVSHGQEERRVRPFSAVESSSPHYLSKLDRGETSRCRQAADKSNIPFDFAMGEFSRPLVDEIDLRRIDSAPDTSFSPGNKSKPQFGLGADSVEREFAAEMEWFDEAMRQRAREKKKEEIRKLTRGKSAPSSRMKHLSEVPVVIGNRPSRLIKVTPTQHESDEVVSEVPKKKSKKSKKKKGKKFDCNVVTDTACMPCNNDKKDPVHPMNPSDGTDDPARRESWCHASFISDSSDDSVIDGEDVKDINNNLKLLGYRGDSFQRGDGKDSDDLESLEELFDQIDVSAIAALPQSTQFSGKQQWAFDCAATNDQAEGDGSSSEGSLMISPQHSPSRNCNIRKNQQQEEVSQGQFIEPFSFFDTSSSADKGRVKINDAKDFESSTIRRMRDPHSEGVSMLVGQRRFIGQDRNEERKEEVITVMFDRNEYSEYDAKIWWELQSSRLLN